MLPQPRRTSEDTCPAHVLPPRTPTGVHPPPRARPPPRALPPRVHSRHACTPATRALPPRVHSRHACTPATRALPPRACPPPCVPGRSVHFFHFAPTYHCAHTAARPTAGPPSNFHDHEGSGTAWSTGSFVIMGMSVLRGTVARWVTTFPPQRLRWPDGNRARFRGGNCLTLA